MRSVWCATDTSHDQTSPRKSRTNGADDGVRGWLLTGPACVSSTHVVRSYTNNDTVTITDVTSFDVTSRTFVVQNNSQKREHAVHAGPSTQITTHYNVAYIDSTTPQKLSCAIRSVYVSSVVLSKGYRPHNISCNNNTDRHTHQAQYTFERPSSPVCYANDIAIGMCQKKERRRRRRQANITVPASLLRSRWFSSVWWRLSKGQ